MIEILGDYADTNNACILSGRFVVNFIGHKCSRSGIIRFIDCLSVN